MRKVDAAAACSARDRRAGRNEDDVDPVCSTRRLAAIGAACFAYLVLFFLQSSHARWLALPLIPDHVVGGWFGEDGSLAALRDRGGVLFHSLAIIATATGAGWLVLRALRLHRSLDRGEQLIFSVALGLAVQSTWTLVAGLAGWIASRTLFMSPMLLAAAAGLGVWLRQRIADMRRNKQDDAARLPGEGAPDRDASDEVPSGDTVRDATGAARRGSRLAWLLIPLALPYLLGGMLPPWEFDVLEYHLQAPKEWYQSGRITFMPHNVYANMPLGAEMHALRAAVESGGPDGWWRGGLAGKTVVSLIAPLTALALWLAGRRFSTSYAGVAAAVAYLSIPWIVHVSLAGLIDGVVGWYGLLTLYAFWLARRSSDCPALAALAGLMAGAAAACKYPAVVFVLVPGGAAWLCRRTWPTRRAWLALTAYCLAAAAVCGPWLVKNAVLAGNPVYPLAYGLFGGETRDDAKDAQWRQAHRAVDAGGRTYSVRQLSDSVAQVGWKSPWLSPLIWPLILIAAAWPGSQRRVAVPLGIVAAGFAGWWLLTHRIDRFWLPLLPVMALVAGVGAERLASRIGRAATNAGLCFVCGLLMLVNSSPGEPGELLSNNQYFVPLESQRRQLALPSHVWLDEHLPPGSRVLLVGDARPFDLRTPALYHTCFDDCPLVTLLAGRTTRDERLAALHAAGVTHLLVDWNEIDRYRRPGNYGFPESVTRQWIRETLTRDERLLRPLPSDPQWGEIDLFEVVRD